MVEPVLFGAAYSVYTRIARLALLEKRVKHRFEEIDIFAADGPPAAYLERQPFGRIPAFEHDGFELYQTAAICRYVDEAFSGPSLQPGNPRARARVAQLVGILDSYAYRPMVWGIFVERQSKPQRGETPDEAAIAEALVRADLCLSTLKKFMGEGEWFGGKGVDLSLADLHAAPMIAYLQATPEGAELLARYPSLAVWWGRISRRPAMLATPWPMIADPAAEQSARVPK
jgi:glutathione S-transferase